MGHQNAAVHLEAKDNIPRLCLLEGKKHRCERWGWEKNDKDKKEKQLNRIKRGEGREEKERKEKK